MYSIDHNVDNRTKGQKDQKTKGPKDKRTKGQSVVLHLKDVYVLVFLAKHSNILACLHCLSLATNLKRVSRSLLWVIPSSWRSWGRDRLCESYSMSGCVSHTHWVWMCECAGRLYRLPFGSQHLWPVWVWVRVRVRVVLLSDKKNLNSFETKSHHN